MLTVNDIVEMAFGRVGEITSTYPTSRGPMWQRIGHRQRQLFARAAKLNPERFGVCAYATLATVDGHRVADLTDIADPVPTPETIQRVTIRDKGTSAYADGQEVAIVTLDDQDAELDPRALLRDRVLIGVGADLDDVTSIEIWYSRLPALIDRTDGAVEVELEAPWDTLLELDLTKWLLTKATQLSDATRQQAIAAFAAEEALLLSEFDEHVIGYAPAVSRFANAPKKPSRPEV